MLDPNRWMRHRFQFVFEVSSLEISMGESMGELMHIIIKPLDSGAFYCIWRREGDSNPRYWFTQYTRLAGEPDRPLRHLSKAF